MDGFGYKKAQPKPLLKKAFDWALKRGLYVDRRDGVGSFLGQ